MTPWRTGLVIGLVALGVVVSARMSLRAQDRAAGDGPARKAARDEPETTTTVQEALYRPLPLPFNAPTRLDEVCRHLGRVLRAPVVLDRAALDRQELTPDVTVQLELEGVRLKTGLKLLLDQVGLTYRVVPEDNLLIVTDREGSDDPLERIHAELVTLHRDIHAIQDELSYLREDLGLEEGGPQMRKPTIIEEKPGGEKGADRPEPDPQGRGPGARPGASTRSRPGA